MSDNQEIEALRKKLSTPEVVLLPGVNSIGEYGDSGVAVVTTRQEMTLQDFLEELSVFDITLTKRETDLLRLVYGGPKMHRDHMPLDWEETEAEADAVLRFYSDKATRPSTGDDAIQVPVAKSEASAFEQALNNKGIVLMRPMKFYALIRAAPGGYSKAEGRDPESVIFTIHGKESRKKLEGIIDIPPRQENAKSRER